MSDNDTCVAVIKGTEKCTNEREPGWRYCSEHKNRPRAVKERESAALNNVVESTNVVAGAFGKEEVPDDRITVSENPTAVQPQSEIVSREARQPASIFDKVVATLDRATEFSEDAYKLYIQRLELAKAGDPEGLRYTDKAGAEQIRGEWTVYERALDREIRAVTAVAKLNIENQALNMNKVLKEIIRSVVTRVFQRMELTPEEINTARQYLAEEFEKQNKGNQSK